jgi:hypothetical protein
LSFSDLCAFSIGVSAIFFNDSGNLLHILNPYHSAGSLLGMQNPGLHSILPE